MKILLKLVVCFFKMGEARTICLVVLVLEILNVFSNVIHNIAKTGKKNAIVTKVNFSRLHLSFIFKLFFEFLHYIISSFPELL